MARALATLALVIAIGAAEPFAGQRATSSRTSPSLSLEVVTEPWIGDFGEMVRRRRIRILTLYNRTHYFVDGGVQRGLVYEAGVKLEAELNRKLGTTSATRVHVVFVPADRDEIFQSLVEGRGDLIATSRSAPTTNPSAESRGPRSSLCERITPVTFLPISLTAAAIPRRGAR